MNLKEYLSSKSKFIDNELEKLFKENDTLSKSMKYSLTAGGKRLRPILSILVFEALKGVGNILPLALALEFIHTYSLIHDDLPSMDNDDFRRGKLTNHKVFGEAVSVLAGDALLTEAFAQLSQLDFDKKNVVNVIKYVSAAAGKNGMVSGQVFDIENSGRDFNLEYLVKTSNLKTGALLRASVVSPAILLGKEYKNLEIYGNSIGLAFQIIDDVLGATSTKEELGKSINIDESNNKITFVTVLGVDGATRMAKEEVEKAKTAISYLNNTYLVELADYIVSRKK